MIHAIPIRSSLAILVMLSGIMIGGGCAAPRGDTFANAVQVTPGELTSVGTTEKTGSIQPANQGARPANGGNVNSLNSSTPPATQIYRAEKPPIDMSWLDADCLDAAALDWHEPSPQLDAPCVGAVVVTASHFPADQAPAMFVVNSNECVTRICNFTPNDGVLPAGYDQPSAAFTGTLMGLETPGVEPLPPLSPNFPPYGATAPPIVIERPRLGERIWDAVKGDHANYYSWQSLAALSSAFGIGSIMANTSIDQTLRDEYLKHYGSSTKNTLHSFKFLGEGKYALPVWAGATLVEVFFPDTMLGDSVGRWGERSLRAALVGGPPMLLMQFVTGASRPGESSTGSHWNFFKDNNGVSGHSFIGAVSFITAAKMTDNPFLKTGFYAGSVLAGLSRINDDAHYPSQVLLGWFMAYMACTAVDLTDFESEHVAIVPLTAENTTGIGLEFRR